MRALRLGVLLPFTLPVFLFTIFHGRLPLPLRTPWMSGAKSPRVGVDV